jgi:hypothetical protein
MGKLDVWFVIMWDLMFLVGRLEEARAGVAFTSIRGL